MNLAHVFLHLFAGFRFDFFDEEDGATSDDIEKQADKFTLETLIPPGVWDQCLSRFALSAEAVRNDAERLGIHPSQICDEVQDLESDPKPIDRCWHPLRNEG